MKKSLGNETGPMAPTPNEIPTKKTGTGFSRKEATSGTAGKSLDPKRFPKA